MVAESPLEGCPGGDCQMDCDGMSTCNVTCTGGGCQMACDGGSTCILDCTGAATECQLDCQGVGSMGTCIGNCVANNCP